MLAEGARFPSREAEERVKGQLLGRTIRDIAFGEGGREANEETRTEASGETGCGLEVDGEQEEERAVEGTPTAEAWPAMRRQWVTRVKKRWRALTGWKARAVKVTTRRPVLRLKRVRHRAPTKASEPVTETQGTTTPPTIRSYLSLTIGGKVYPALLDSGATCSLAGPPLVERFADRLKSSNSWVQSVKKKGSKIIGVLPVMLQVDARSECIKFKAVDDAEQQIILGMDFCRAFGIGIKSTGWTSRGGRRHDFAQSAEELHPGSPVMGKCAGLSNLDDEQRAEVERLVDEALADQPDGPGLTRLIEHHIRVTEERPFKHKMRRSRTRFFSGGAKDGRQME